MFRASMVAVLFALLTACVSDGEFLPEGGGLYGRSPAVVDDEKCQELGFKPGTEAYGNCRLKLEEIRALRQAELRRTANRASSSSNGRLSMLCRDALIRNDNGAAFVHC